MPGRKPRLFGWVSKRVLSGLPASLAVAGLCASGLLSPSAANSVADFFAGKSMSLIAGFPPGGGYDTYIRVLARHYGKFLPGHPSMIRRTCLAPDR